MHVLITGASGYFGSVLLSRLLSAPHVTKVSVFAREGGMLNQRELPPTVGVVRHEALHASSFKAQRFDAIFHLAAGRNSTEPDQLAHSLTFTNLLMSVASQAGVKRIFNASSQAVYGASKRQGLWDEHATPAPITPYGLSKYAGELLVSNASEQSVSLRFTKLVGPSPEFRVCSSEVPHVLCRHALAKAAVIIRQPNQQFDLLDVRDAANACVRLLEIDATALPLILNIGSGRQVSMRACAEVVDRVGQRDLATPLRYRIEQTETDEAPRDFGMSIARMKSVCGWEPAIPLEATVRDIFQALRMRT